MQSEVTDAMVEAAAMALQSVNDCSTTLWADLPDYGQDRIRDQARAAIEAALTAQQPAVVADAVAGGEVVDWAGRLNTLANAVLAGSATGSEEVFVAQVNNLIAAIRSMHAAALSTPPAAPQPVSSPDELPAAVVPEYRLLRRGEVILATDELLRDDCTRWEAVTGFAIGLEFDPVALVSVRRLAAAPAGKDGGA